MEATMSPVHPLRSSSRTFLLTILALLLALGCAGLAEPVRADVGREAALQALDSTEPAQRRDAVAALGDEGTMADIDRLIEALHDQDAGVREVAETAVWKIWLRSDDPAVNALMQEGMRDMAQNRLGAAVDAFTRVIEKQPDFAEGWNKRATVYFLMGDFDQSLADCDETLKRNPNHFGALAGCGAIYAQRDELEQALEYFERALEVNPNMPGVEQALGLVRERLATAGRRST